MAIKRLILSLFILLEFLLQYLSINPERGNQNKAFG